MLRTPRTAPRNSAKSFASALAMAFALAGGAAVATSVAPVAAAAQDYTKAFVEAYQPVADVVNAEGGDIASVVPQFDTLESLAETADDRDALGGLIVTAGSKVSSVELQRRGLEMRLAAGKLPPEAIPQYYWYVGNLALNMEDYGAARDALISARAAGWTEDDPVGLIAETYYQQDDAAGGVNFIENEVNSIVAAGGTPPANWMLRGLSSSYNNDAVEPAVKAGLMLLEYHPSQTHWMNALQVANALADVEEDVQLDILRLMRVTNSLTDDSEYIRYIRAADPRIMSNEIDGLLADALREGLFESDDPYVQDVRSTVNSRIAGDREEAPSMVAEAESDPTGESAMLAGDVLMSLNDWAGAEAMYAMAAEKGGVDVDTNLALLRIGMMQARQGKGAEAVATLGRVTGPRELPAKFWAAYAETL